MFRELLKPCCVVTEEQATLLEAHYESLLRWNKVMNLTRMRSVKEAVQRHYCESLFLAGLLPSNVASLADIGSGAGFPGYPFAVVRPTCRVALIEANQRKAVFLQEVTRGMPNVRVFGVRAEDVEERFECVASRAVGYTELRKAAWKLGGRLALLTGKEPPPGNWSLEWDVIPIPGSQNRFLRISRQDVSRGTPWSQARKP